MRRGIFWPTAATSSSGLEKPGLQPGMLTAQRCIGKNAERQRGDFQQMQVRAVSEMTYWSAMALRRLGRKKEATSLFVSILDYATELEEEDSKDRLFCYFPADNAALRGRSAEASTHHCDIPPSTGADRTRPRH